MLVGREGLLADLAAESAPGGGVSVRVLSGLGGVGKTSVAVEFAHRGASRYGLVWQFNAEDPAALAAQVGQLACALGVAGRPGDLLTAVHARLAGMRERWLLVLDNVMDPAVVRQLVPSAGPGDVVITSQRADWPDGWMLPVPVLARAAAVDFLLAHAHDEDAEAAGRVADALGSLPLALAQGAAFLRKTGRPTARYLDLLSSERARVLGRVVGGGYGRAVAGAWSAAVDQARETPGALGLLRLLACCAPDAVPVRLLLPDGRKLPGGIDRDVARQLSVLTADRLALDEALIALSDFSLIGPVRAGMVSVHRLVQANTMDALDEASRDAWRTAAASLIVRALPDDPGIPGGWPRFAALLPHAEAVLPPWHVGMNHLAVFLFQSGSHHAARAAARRLLTACTWRYGAYHRGTLTVRYNLARFTGSAGDAMAARDMFAELVLICERIKGYEHTETLIARNQLASHTGEAGDAARARDMFAELLPVEERVQGPEHPSTLTTRHNLAYWTGLAGDVVAATEMLAALLPVRGRVLPAGDPETLTTAFVLARFIGEAGDAAMARDMLADLLPLRARIQGPEHPETLITRSELARFTGTAGDLFAAREMLAELLPVHERVAGPVHPAALTTRHNLAQFTGLTGDEAGAREMFVRLLPVRERVQGPEHPDTLSARRGLATWTDPPVRPRRVDESAD
ncbi:tetratricopeptide repeat protein [Actinospica durhamensis]|uniref:Tetratricopeptide repeat protein n=1 Tax=Actinospica durhamensis TaxID=1508375 RepID=A0A941EQC1_9ACTN|nr:FxSxx-COOH system tetratricopeptide repeat protein [Actinospica durhamensis]MBR7835420.1 tetratricopeptide repeat protein [Actinospica durhamensis]